MVSLFKIVGKKTSLLSCVVNLFLRDQKEKKPKTFTQSCTQVMKKRCLVITKTNLLQISLIDIMQRFQTCGFQICRSMAVILGKTGSHACCVIGRPFFLIPLLDRHAHRQMHSSCIAGCSFSGRSNL